MIRIHWILIHFDDTSHQSHVYWRTNNDNDMVRNSLPFNSIRPNGIGIAMVEIQIRNTNDGTSSTQIFSWIWTIRCICKIILENLESSLIRTLTHTHTHTNHSYITIYSDLRIWKTNKQRRWKGCTVLMTCQQKIWNNIIELKNAWMWHIIFIWIWMMLNRPKL